MKTKVCLLMLITSMVLILSACENPLNNVMGSGGSSEPSTTHVTLTEGQQMKLDAQLSNILEQNETDKANCFVKRSPLEYLAYVGGKAVSGVTGSSFLLNMTNIQQDINKKNQEAREKQAQALLNAEAAQRKINESLADANANRALKFFGEEQTGADQGSTSATSSPTTIIIIGIIVLILIVFILSAIGKRNKAPVDVVPTSAPIIETPVQPGNTHRMVY